VVFPEYWDPFAARLLQARATRSATIATITPGARPGAIASSSERRRRAADVVDLADSAAVAARLGDDYADPRRAIMAAALPFRNERRIGPRVAVSRRPTA
jgi:hypothetical protein